MLRPVGLSGLVMTSRARRRSPRAFAVSAQTLIASGLEDGDLVIVSTLDAVTDGMTIRRADAEAGIVS